LSEQKPTLLHRIFSWFQPDKTPSEAELIEVRVQTAVDSIAGNETLTDGLDDQAAQVLLKWGLNSARSLAQRSGEDISERLQSLRLLLRAINRWASSQPLTAHADQHPLLIEILERAAAFYATPFPGDRPAMLAEIIENVGATPDPEKLIRGLITWLEEKSTTKE
jgi:hypothetical protein